MTGNIAHFPTMCECRSIAQASPTGCKSNSIIQHFPTMCKAPGFIPKSREEGGGRRGARHKGKRGWESGGVEGEKEEQEKKVGKTEGSEEEAGKGEEIVQTS